MFDEYFNDEIQDYLETEESVYEKTTEKADLFVSKQKNKKKNNYTCELELKSLLIRIKNDRLYDLPKQKNNQINKYIKWYKSITNKKYDDYKKFTRVKNKLRNKIIELSEKTSIDDKSYERFGAIVLLMIKNILRKPQFSGYTYKDEFYSDAVYKILKYLNNFDHKIISEKSGNPVNAFAYISQIIHNSIIFVINTKKKEQEKIKKHIQDLNMDNLINFYNITVDDTELHYERYYKPEKFVEETVNIDFIETSLVNEVKKLQDDIERVDKLTIFYPKNYNISFDEYNELKKYLKGKVSIVKSKKWKESKNENRYKRIV